MLDVRSSYQIAYLHLAPLISTLTDSLANLFVPPCLALSVPSPIYRGIGIDSKAGSQMSGKATTEELAHRTNHANG
jgi:hypothetical protein